MSTYNQLTLDGIDAPVMVHDGTKRKGIEVGNLIKSCGDDETQMVSDILALHNGTKPVDADFNYSVGRIWEFLPKPLRKFDIKPKTPDVEFADMASLPLDDGSIESAFFDPPFLVKTGNGSRMKDVFGQYETYDALVESYQKALDEAYRVLKPSGIAIFKCQSFVNSGRQHWVDVKILTWAEDAGFYGKDRFTYIRENVMGRPGEYNQEHARKISSTFWVFQKPKAGRHE